MARQILLSDREAWANGLFKLQAYEPVPSLPVAETFSAATQVGNPLEAIGGFHQLDLRQWRPNVLNLLGVRYLLLQLQQPRVELLGWKLVWSGRIPQQFIQRGTNSLDLPVAIYENLHALPRAFVLGQTIVIPRGKGSIEVVAKSNPRDGVVVSRDLLPPGPRQGFAPAKITEYRGSRVTISAHLDAPGYLVLTDANAPGWTARLSSAPNTPELPIQSVYTSLRGIPLPAGDHTVTMTYQPPGLIIGSILSLITGLIAVVVWVVERRLTSRRTVDPGSRQSEAIAAAPPRHLEPVAV